MSIKDIEVIELCTELDNRPPPMTRAELTDRFREVLEENLGKCLDKRFALEIETKLRRLARAFNDAQDDFKARLPVVLFPTIPTGIAMVTDEMKAQGFVNDGTHHDPQGRYRVERIDPSVFYSRHEPEELEELPPKWKHDAACCTYLGRYDASTDLYWCEQHGLPTVIARFGDGGQDYTSGMMLAAVEPSLAEAKRRAIKRGLRCR